MIEKWQKNHQRLLRVGDFCDQKKGRVFIYCFAKKEHNILFTV